MNIGFRFSVILIVIGFFAWKAYHGIWKGELELGIDLQGGSQLDFKFDFAESKQGSRAKLLTEAIKIIQDRIDGYGLKDINITPIGDDRFSVQVSAKDKKVVDSIKDLITVLGRLEFRITVEPGADNYKDYWKIFQSRVGNVDDPQTLLPTDIKGNDNYPHGLRWYQLSDKGKKS